MRICRDCRGKIFHLATRRGQRRRLRFRGLKQRLAEFAQLAASMNNGLEKRLNTATGALDPHTSATLMQATNARITEDHLTALMITHHMEDAIKYGNRLLVLKAWQIKADLTGKQKPALTPEKLAAYFE